MEQQLSDARTRIIQLTAEVQSSKHVAEQREERADSLQAQVASLPFIYMAMPAFNQPTYEQDTMLGHPHTPWH